MKLGLRIKQTQTLKMIQSIDYYSKRERHANLWHREIISISIIKKIARKGDLLLDAGCGQGTFMAYLSKKLPFLKVEGAEYSKSQIEMSRKKGFEVSRANFEKNMPFKKESFDIVYAAEVIEHLYNPDNFLKEVNRITKKGGYIIISTPNLCAWFNRFLMLLGIQPLFLEMSTKSKQVGSGVIGKLRTDKKPVGHIRIFTMQAIKDLLKMNGFEIIRINGSIFDSGLPKKLLWIDKIFSICPNIASSLVILARKIN